MTRLQPDVVLLNDSSDSNRIFAEEDGWMSTGKLQVRHVFCICFIIVLFYFKYFVVPKKVQFLDISKARLVKCYINIQCNVIHTGNLL